MHRRRLPLQRGGCGSTPRDLGSDRLDQGGEGLGVLKRDGSEDLPIELDAGNLQGVDETAVGDAIGAGRGIDADDPEAADLTLLVAPVAVSVLERLEERVLSNPEDCAATTTETRGLLQHFVTTTAGSASVTVTPEIVLLAVVSTQMELSRRQSAAIARPQSTMAKNITTEPTNK